MSRINVYGHNDEWDYEGTRTLEGWFDSSKADRWTDADYNGNGSGGTGRGQAIWRTAQGRWVMQNWSAWQGEEGRFEFTTPEAAREWLLSNDNDDAVAEHFGEIEEERGPGRPKVGEQVCFTVPPEDLALVDAIVESDSSTRSAVLRRAVAAFVASENVRALGR